MAIKNRATLAADIAAQFPDNGLNQITALRLRTYTGDDVDSAFNLTDDDSDDIVEGLVNLFLTVAERAKIARDWQFNVLAGSGVDFTAGVDNQVTMPIAAPGDDEALVRVFFDGAFQDPSQFSISGTTMTFTSIIPVGVESITIYVLA